MSSDKLFLLDGTALAYRAYFAFIKSNLQNSEGISTGPVFGFANTIVRLMDAENPTHIAVIWDTSEPTFRHEMDEQYKANRPPQPEELQVTIPLMKEMLGYWGIPCLEKDGYEADDIIGTLAAQAKAEDIEVYLVTPDKDFMQLVGDNIKMYKPKFRGDGFDVIDRQGVIDYFGVPPEKVIDVLAIIGDSSDNIPGVPGVGKKGAPELIKEYGSLEALIDDAPNLKSKRAREGLTENAEQARLSRKMIVIDTQVPETPNWQQLKHNGHDDKKLGEFFRRMEFKTLTERFLGEQASAEIQKKRESGQGLLFDDQGEQEEPESQFDRFDQQKVDYKLVNSSDKLGELVDELSAVKTICFDTETTSTDAMIADLMGVALTSESGKGWYIACNSDGLSTEQVTSALRPFLEDPERLKVAHHYKYDYLVMKRHGIEVKGEIFDTMLAAYLIDSGQRFGMDELAKTYLGYEPVSIESLIGKKGKKQKNIKDIPVEEVSPYACEDADVTYRLYEVLEPKLKELGVMELASDIEFPLSHVLAEMEWDGIMLDAKILSGLSEQMKTEMAELKQQIFEKSGEEFNINSTQQLGEILFKKLKLPSQKKTSTGQPSTSEDVLARLAVEYDIAQLILDYRKLNKLRSTYVDALPKLIHPETGRIHTSFNQHVTATGRLSSSDPNLQNIPVRSERGREVRKAFVADSQKKLIAADYSQIELRVIAHISGDEAMIAAFNNDEDIHARTAKEIFGLASVDEVDREYRRKAKEVNFGIPYGVSAFGLAQRLGIGRNEGREIIEAYFERFPKIKEYIDLKVEFARENGYVTTLAGRRRTIPDINSKNRNVRGFAERTAINTPIQGTAADLIKIAMINVFNSLQENNLETRMLLQVHDELIFEAPDGELEKAGPLITEAMEGAMQLNVPLRVELGIADNWLEAH